jgi:hypothetical protein
MAQDRREIELSGSKLLEMANKCFVAWLLNRKVVVTQTERERFIA